jgi:hypothetical protein
MTTKVLFASCYFSGILVCIILFVIQTKVQTEKTEPGTEEVQSYSLVFFFNFLLFVLY